MTALIRAKPCRPCARAAVSDTSLSWASTYRVFPSRRCLQRLVTTYCLPQPAVDVASYVSTKSLECRSGLAFPLLLRQDFALIHPALHSDNTVGRACFGEAEIDVSA